MYKHTPGAVESSSCAERKLSFRPRAPVDVPPETWHLCNDFYKQVVGRFFIRQKVSVLAPLTESGVSVSVSCAGKWPLSNTPACWQKEPLFSTCRSAVSDLHAVKHASFWRSSSRPIKSQIIGKEVKIFLRNWMNSNMYK